MSVPLTYDTLPHYSRLRRDVIDGVLQLTAAPQDPSPMMRRTVMLGSAVPAACTCLVVLVVGFAIFGSMYAANRAMMPDWLAVVLGVCFTILCGALFALVWRIQYMSRMEQIHKALGQSTIIAASPGRLIIETTGPFGTASHDFREIVCEFGIVQCDRQHNVDCIQVAISDGSRLQILPGRDRAELNWVIRELSLALEPPKQAS